MPNIQGPMHEGFANLDQTPGREGTFGMPGGSSPQAVAAIAVLGRISPAVLMLEADGSIIWENPSATELLRAFDLRSRTRFLPDAPARVQRITNPAGQSLLVTKIPVDAAPDSLDGDARIVSVVIATVENEQQTLDPHLLEFLYELTPAEARVAVEITGGKTISEIANELNVASSTVRSQLKNVFGKMGVRRQPELVMRVLSVATLRLA